MRAALGIAVVLAALAAVALLGAGRVLVVADPLPPRADAIVILAGSVPDRTLEAADLYRAGLAPRVVVTRERLPRGQAALRARGVRLPEGDELTVKALRELGVPPGAIVVLGRRAVSTESEARTIARWACAHRLRRLIVVTSRAHSRRARLILRQALGGPPAPRLCPGTLARSGTLVGPAQPSVPDPKSVAKVGGGSAALARRDDEE